MPGEFVEDCSNPILSRLCHFWRGGVLREKWFKRRCYLHFDAPISYLKAKQLVEDPKKVACWSFFPLLHVTLDSKKIVRAEDNSLKFKEKKRDIYYAAHSDSHIYSYYSNILCDKYEILINMNELNNNIIGFRKLKNNDGKGKCNIHFAQQAFQDIIGMAPCSVLCFDIKGFFDNLDHFILKKAWSFVLEKDKLPCDHYNIFKSLIKFSYVERKDIFKRFTITKKSIKNKDRICSISEFRDIVRKEKYISKYSCKYGIPQGTPISGVLSNIYMLDFDINLKKIANKYQAIYYRYCDDIILICKPSDELFFKNIISLLIYGMKLEISKSKTIVRHFRINKEVFCDKPVQYLGFMFDGQRTYIRSSSYIRFLNKMKRGVSLARQTARKYNRIKITKDIKIRNIYRKKLYSRYSYLGKRNFISYAMKAAKIMNDNTIKKQVKPLWKKLLYRISCADEHIL